MSTTLSTNNLITSLFDDVHQLLNNYTQQGFDALNNALAEPLGIAISLYIILVGFAITQGWVELSMRNFVKSTLKIGIVYTAATNWGWVNEYFIDLVNAIINTISNTMVTVGDGDITASLHGSIGNGLQIALNRILDLVTTYFKNGSMTNITPYIEGVLLFLAGMLVIAIGTAEILMATCFVAILFAFTPFMVSLALFNPTHAIFERWLSAISANGMVIIFVSAMVGVVLVVLGWAFPSTMPEKVNLVQMATPFIVALLCACLLLKAAAIGRAIGGGVVVASGLSAAMGTIGAAMAATQMMRRSVAGHNPEVPRTGLVQTSTKIANSLRKQWRGKSGEQ